MQIDKTKIEGTEFMFIVSCFIQASSMLTAFFTSITKQDSWILVIIGFGISLISLLIYSELMKQFLDKNLIQINEMAFGPILGKIFSIIYFLFFLTLSSVNTKDLGNFV